MKKEVLVLSARGSDCSRIVFISLKSMLYWVAWGQCGVSYNFVTQNCSQRQTVSISWFIQFKTRSSSCLLLQGGRSTVSVVTASIASSMPSQAIVVADDMHCIKRVELYCCYRLSSSNAGGTLLCRRLLQRISRRVVVVRRRR